MFQKAILLIFAISTLFVISGCKVIEEYAKSSRKYNSNRSYRQKTSYNRRTVPRLSPGATKNILQTVPSGRGGSLWQQHNGRR